jgi:CheY-like chemotaxis protein
MALAAPLIVVVDDDAASLNLLIDLLTDEGYRTVGCRTSAAAAIVIQQFLPDLIITDLWLDRSDDGFPLLEWMQGGTMPRPIPLIICSADTRMLGAHAAQFGARGWAVLEKPFDIEDLLAKVVAAIGPPRGAASA